MTDETDRWLPVRRGLTYCSPRGCGRGCTIIEYDRAVIEANALAESLGMPWKPRVWENLGWHYSAVADDSEPYGLRIYPEHNGGYRTYFGSWPSVAGATPQEALQAMSDAIHAEAERFNEALSVIDSVFVYKALTAGANR